jgi:YesN/AraC family two-component response regulator
MILTKIFPFVLEISKYIFVLFFATFFLHAQESQQDSIKIYLEQLADVVKEKDQFKEDFLIPEFLLSKKDRVTGKEKVLTLLKLFNAFIYKSSEEANSYNEEALKYATQIQFKQGILGARYNSAYLFFIKGDFDKSMELVKDIEKIVDYKTFPQVYSDIMTLKSDIYTERGEYDLALDTGLRLLDQAEKSQNDYALMRANAALSHFYLRIEHFSKALSYCIKGLHYIIKLKKMQYIYPKIDEIARMTAKLNGVNQALKIYEFYGTIEKEIPPPGSYIQSAVYMNMADIFISNGDLDKAQIYLSQALKLNYDNNYNFRIPRALTLQAELSLKKKDTSAAILNFEKSIDAAEKIEAFDVIKGNSLILTQIFENTRQPSKANEYRSLNKSLVDSLFNNEKDQKIAILEARRKIKEFMHQQKILELQNNAQNTRFKTITSILALLFLIAGIALYGYLKVRKKNRFLFRRTIELTKLQLETRKKLSTLENGRIRSDAVAHSKNPSKTCNSIDEDIKNIILTRLDTIEKEKFFLDPNCSLQNLALKLKTNPKYLSQVINQEKKLHFNNYINELRINHLLTKLLTDKDFRECKLSYISASVGYNNLNTFNAAFKKKQGILPSYFIDELIQESKKVDAD